jgi:hypothetical protein
MLDSPVMDSNSKSTSKSLDERFDEVAQGFLDQRDYTTFCFDRLRSEIQSEFSDVRGGIGSLDGRLDRLDGRLDRLDRRLDRHELVLGEILTEVKAQRPR